MREMTAYRWGGGRVGVERPRATRCLRRTPPQKAQNKPRRGKPWNDGIRLSPRRLCSPSAQTPQPPTVCVHPLPPAVWLPATEGELAASPASSRARTDTRTPCQMPAQRSDAEEERRSPTDSHHSRAVSSTNASERADENPGIRASQVPCRKLHWRIRCCGNLSAQI